MRTSVVTYYKWPLILLLAVHLTGCTTSVKVKKYKHPTTGHQESVTPYAQPKEESSLMIASWYGIDFHGRPTASGEIYNMYAFTAAHKTLPFGTLIKVTNPQTEQSANVVVNDRGPFVEGRDIDLSYGSAKEIGLVGQGVGLIEVEFLGRDNKYVKYIRVYDAPTKGPHVTVYTIQIASFEDKQNALRLKKALELAYTDVFIREASVNGKTFYRVRVGRYQDKVKAIATANTLAQEGYDTLVSND
ncbi:MAG: septal ring lytic transglycosylase RlpA family protein [Nitrospirae bacterium]|nr:septal ring lytic transglycosylase RlpA family protein [Nitrospirota bacterium]